jgi:hypothetical protein
LLYTIEARELTNVESKRMTVEAGDADEAIQQYVRDSAAELVSFTSPRGEESIATVKKEDTVFLVRVYSA